MRGVKKVVGLRQTPRVPEIITSLHEMEEAQTRQAARDYVTCMIRDLQQATACVKQTPQVAPRLALPMTEHDLREADQAEHAFRSVGRLLCAGQPFAFLASPKKECLKDFQILLGQFYDMSRFPVRGGRLVIADVLTRMLGIPVSLVDIKRWFPTPDSQKMTVHQELSGLLSCRGMTWPPQADCFWQCSRYRCVQLSSKQTLDSQASLTASSTTVLDFLSGVSTAGDVTVGPHTLHSFYDGDVIEQTSSSQGVQQQDVVRQH